MKSRREGFRACQGLALAGFVSAALAAGCIATAENAAAAESATGAYILGLRGAGAGVTPPEGIFFSSQKYFYNGEISGNIPFEDGSIVGSAEITAMVEIPTLLWVTPITIGSAKVGTSLTIPFGNVEVEGNVGPIALSDSTFTVGDPSIGLFIGDRIGQFHWQFGATGFLPIGDYHEGEIANVAKHRAAIDVYGALTWLEPELGLDFTNIVGVTFNAKNQATEYRTGTEFHWEWALTKKFENGFSLGAVGYHYNQLTGDSGAGAVLGDFEGKVTAVGATLGYDFRLGRIPVSSKFRFYHEFGTENRLEGNSAFLSISSPLWVAGQN